MTYSSEPSSVVLCKSLDKAVGLPLDFQNGRTQGLGKLMTDPVFSLFSLLTEVYACRNHHFQLSEATKLQPLNLQCSLSLLTF